MGISAMFFTNPDYLTGEPVEIFEVVELSQRQFKCFQEQPFIPWPWLWKNEPLMYQGEDATSCLLVLGKDSTDGILAFSKSQTIQKAAYFPAAKQYLESAVQRIAHSIWEEVLREEGSLNIPFAKYGEEYGISLIPNTRLSKLVQDAVCTSDLDLGITESSHGYWVEYPTGQTAAFLQSQDMEE